MSFGRAVSFVLEREGEWANHPRDPGKRTRWGISSAAHPDVDLDTLTREGAEAIYRAEYWDPIRGDALPWPVSLVVFDTAVQYSPERGVRMLQAFCGAHIDGICGPETQAAAGNVDPHALVLALLEERVSRYLASPNFDAFGRGWINRLLALGVECGAWLAR